MLFLVLNNIDDFFIPIKHLIYFFQERLNKLLIKQKERNFERKKSTQEAK